MEQFFADVINMVKRGDAATFKRLVARPQFREAISYIIPELWPALLVVDRETAADEQKTTGRFELYEELGKFWSGPESYTDSGFGSVADYWRNDGTLRRDDDALYRHYTRGGDHAMARSVPPADLSVTPELIRTVVTSCFEISDTWMRLFTRAVRQGVISHDQWWEAIKNGRQGYEIFDNLYASGDFDLIRPKLASLPQGWSINVLLWRILKTAISDAPLDPEPIFEFVESMIEFSRYDRSKQELKIKVAAARWLATHQLALTSPSDVPSELHDQMREYIACRLKLPERWLLLVYSRITHHFRHLAFIHSAMTRDEIWRELDLRWCIVHELNVHHSHTGWCKRETLALPALRHVIAWEVAHRQYWLPWSRQSSTAAMGAVYVGSYRPRREDYFLQFWRHWTRPHPVQARTWFFIMVLCNQHGYDDNYYRFVTPEATLPVARFIRIATRLPQELQHELVKSLVCGELLEDETPMTDDEIIRWIIQLLGDPFFALSE